MLQAQNGRQLNLAADVVRKFLTTKNVSLKHSDALQLVSQLIGYPSYNAARASMTGTSKGVAPAAATWRELAHAIGTLNAEQLDMRIEIADSRLFREISTYGRDATVQLASPGWKVSGETSAAPAYPVLLVTDNEAEFDAAASYEAELVSEDANRIRHQFEVATSLSSDIVDETFQKYGLRDAIVCLNSEYALQLSVGRYVAYSEIHQGFLNADFGFVTDKASATGFGSSADFPKLFAAPDLEMVAYADAVDVDPDNEIQAQVRGTAVSRYQWPTRFSHLWSDVSGRIYELLDASKKLIEAKGYSTQVVAREHEKGTGEELVLELYKGDVFSGEEVFGGRLVFAFSDGLRSGFVVGAALGVFLEIPERASIAYSLNVQRNGEFPYATEAHFFYDELLEQTPQKLAESLMLYANFSHSTLNN